MTKFMLAEPTTNTTLWKLLLPKVNYCVGYLYIHEVPESLNHWSIYLLTNVQTVTDISQKRGLWCIMLVNAQWSITVSKIWVNFTNTHIIIHWNHVVLWTIMITSITKSWSIGGERIRKWFHFRWIQIQNWWWKLLLYQKLWWIWFNNWQWS